MNQHVTVTFAGILLLLLGIVILYTISRRKFNRRAMTGAQRFGTYERAWSTILGERVARWVAIIMIIIGLLLILAKTVNFSSLYGLSK